MHDEQVMIRCAIYRGGTSKGVYLLENDLPGDPQIRDRLILAIYGSPDRRQIDGLGGADPLTSKVAIVGPSSRPDADVDYTFGQVSIAQPFIDYSGNCGNISSGVGPFAIDQGLVRGVEPITEVRIFNTNTRKPIVAHVPVKNGKAAVAGDCAIKGVPGTGAPLVMDFPDCQGSVTGHLLPTAHAQDFMRLSDGQELWVSVVDASNPCVFARAGDLGISGTLLPQAIDADSVLLQRLEEIRSRAAEMIGLVDDWHEATSRSPAVPKMIVISDKTEYSTVDGTIVRANDVDLVARAMSMQKAHKAFPVTGTICTGIASRVKESLVHETVGELTSSDTVRIGHPAGTISVEACVELTDGGLRVRKAAIVRTARCILTGYAYVPLAKLRSPWWPPRELSGSDMRAEKTD